MWCVDCDDLIDECDDIFWNKEGDIICEDCEKGEGYN